MSLIDVIMETCTMLDKITENNGMGGYSTRYVDGASFQAAIVKDSTMQARMAEKTGVTELYTVTVYRGLTLDYHDIFRRESDGQVFRVTSNIHDSTPPSTASGPMQIAQVSAERWVLT